MSLHLDRPSSPGRPSSTPIIKMKREIRKKIPELNEEEVKKARKKIIEIHRKSMKLVSNQPKDVEPTKEVIERINQDMNDQEDAEEIEINGERIDKRNALEELNIKPISHDKKSDKKEEIIKPSHPSAPPSNNANKKKVDRKIITSRLKVIPPPDVPDYSSMPQE